MSRGQLVKRSDTRTEVLQLMKGPCEYRIHLNNQTVLRTCEETKQFRTQHALVFVAMAEIAIQQAGESERQTSTTEIH